MVVKVLLGLVKKKMLCENECYAALEDTCLNQDRYSNNDKCEVMTKLAQKKGTVLQGDENEIFKQLIIFVYKKEKEQLKSLCGIPKPKVKCAVNKVNFVLKKIDIQNLTELNNTMYAAELTNFQRQKRNLGGRDG